MLRRFHAALWEQSVRLDAGDSDIDHRLLDDVNFAVLDKLCSGVKDEAAARQIRVSVRTYRRHVASIMQLLGVGSRFEAGLKVAELGLIGHRRERYLNHG